MKPYIEFTSALRDYFQQIDLLFDDPVTIDPTPAPIVTYRGTLPEIQAVIWDVYGTLCGMELGDLEQAWADRDRLLPAARALVEEFGLGSPLRRMSAEQEPEKSLVELYLQRIEHSHERSCRQGVEYPEVVIEQIWEEILLRCTEAGYRQTGDEDPLDTAYRMGYFFDCRLQTTSLYRGIAECLAALRQAGRIQGIISNAQFYTPLRLRRALRRALKNSDLELEDFFTEPLVLFSYELGFSKPNPRAFERVVKELRRRNIAPENILFIGNDMLNDIAAASAHGLRTLLFAADRDQVNMRAGDPRCEQVRPDAVAVRAEQITDSVLQQGVLH